MKKASKSEGVSRSAGGRQWSAAVAVALAAGLGSNVACAPDRVDEAAKSEDGIVSLALTAPPEVSCVQLQFKAGRTVTRDVTVSGETTTRLDGLPTGAVSVVGAAYAGACGVGDPLWISDPLTVALVGGQPAAVQLVFRKNGIALVSASFQDDVPAARVNIALNTTGAAYPAVETSHYWGGGSYPADLNDGLNAYVDTWAHGIAFTGGQTGWGGEACGERTAGIDFGRPRRLDRVTVWHHGSYEEHAPRTAHIEIFDGASWVPAGDSWAFDLTRDTAVGQQWGSAPTEHRFPLVTASKVRYVTDNCELTTGHGWIYEIEAWGIAE